MGVHANAHVARWPGGGSASPGAAARASALGASALSALVSLSNGVTSGDRLMGQLSAWTIRHTVRPACGHTHIDRPGNAVTRYCFGNYIGNLAIIYIFSSFVCPFV